MMKTVLTAFRFALVMMFFAGLLYPLSITVLGQTLFSFQANGSIIKNDKGVPIASELIGQRFHKPQYFHPRPAVNGYDASNSGGSNFGVTSKKLMERIRSDADSYQKENQVATIPIDAVTASASNLDPHISMANALAQVPRVAMVRHLKPEAVKQLLYETSENHLLSEAPYVNVLALNLALDRE